MIIKNLKWLQPTDNRDSSNYFLAKTPKRPSFDSEAIFSSLSLSLSLSFIFFLPLLLIYPFSSQRLQINCHRYPLRYPLQIADTHTDTHSKSPIPTPTPTPNRDPSHSFNPATIRLPVTLRIPYRRNGSLASDRDG